MHCEKYAHTDPDVFHDRGLTLHDCVADHISCENGRLCFYLPDGFWVAPHHKDNPSDKTVRTDAAAAIFTAEDPDDVIVRVFTRRRWFRSCRTNVELWDMEKLISAVNSGKCVLGFITQYRSHYEQMWECAIRSRRKPYYRECHIYLPRTEATFCWNELRMDREW